MQYMDSWDVALLAVAGYLAVVTLVRVMARYHAQLLNKFREELTKEKKQREAEKTYRSILRRQRAA